MRWLVYAAATAFALGTADFLVKLAAGRLSNSLALLFYGSCAFLTGAAWVIGQRFRGAPQHAESAGILAALGVGIAFTLVTVGLYATFGAGAPVSAASPVIRLSGLLLASLAGIVLLGEPITARYVLGLVLALSGVYLIVNR